VLRERRHHCQGADADRRCSRAEHEALERRPRAHPLPRCEPHGQDADSRHGQCRGAPAREASVRAATSGQDENGTRRAKGAQAALVGGREPARMYGSERGADGHSGAQDHTGCGHRKAGRGGLGASRDHQGQEGKRDRSGSRPAAITAPRAHEDRPMPHAAPVPASHTHGARLAPTAAQSLVADRATP